MSINVKRKVFETKLVTTPSGLISALNLNADKTNGFGKQKAAISI